MSRSENRTGGRTSLAAGLGISVAALCVLLVTGCRETNQYFSRRDTIRLGAGDAAAHNRAVHTIDPWPVHSKNTDIPVSGKRMMVGIERYQRNESIEPEGNDTTERFNKDEGPPPPGPPPGP